MPRFVLLEHDHPFLHWDLMLECGAALRTWRLDRIPTTAGAVAAESLPDHRLAYLDYEGPVSGNRGTVRRIDAGEFSIVDDDAAAAAAANRNEPGVLIVELAGAKLRGTARISSATATLDWQPESA